MKFDGENLIEVIDRHRQWVLCPTNDEDRADFSGANLVGVALPYAMLYGANFRGANLLHACLFGAELEKADFTGANLYETDLRRAKLRGAIGIGYIPQQIPSHGSFIAWKRATLDPEGKHYDNAVIVKLRIPEDAKRISIMNGECKASKVEVLEVQTVEGEVLPEAVAISMKDGRTEYKAGTVIEVDDFVDDMFNEHTPGIFFYLDRLQAVRYLTMGDDPDGRPQPIDFEELEDEYREPGLCGSPPQILDYLVGDDLKEFAFAMKYLSDEEAAEVFLKAYDNCKPEYVAKKLKLPLPEVEAIWNKAKKCLAEKVRGNE